MVYINNLYVIPPMIIAKTISNTVMNRVFFKPNSLIRAAIVAMHGM
jgi:hypothetical protein